MKLQIKVMEKFFLKVNLKLKRKVDVILNAINPTATYTMNHIKEIMFLRKPESPVRRK